MLTSAATGAPEEHAAGGCLGDSGDDAGDSLRESVEKCPVIQWRAVESAAPVLPELRVGAEQGEFVVLVGDRLLQLRDRGPEPGLVGVVAGEPGQHRQRVVFYRPREQ